MALRESLGLALTTKVRLVDKSTWNRARVSILISFDASVTISLVTSTGCNEEEGGGQTLPASKITTTTKKIKDI